MTSPHTSLWTARRGRRVGSGFVAVWDVCIPGMDTILPVLQVTYPCDNDYYDSVDVWEAHRTSVWAWTEEGREIAARIASDIAGSGFSLIYPCEEDLILVEAGAAHQVVYLSEAAE